MSHHRITALPCSKEKGHLVGLKLTDKIPFILQGHTPSFLRFLLVLLLISSNTPRFRAAIFAPRSRAFGSHPRGREFESLQVHQFSSLFFMRSEDF